MSLSAPALSGQEQVAKPTTVNKIGGASMSEMSDVGNLIKVLKGNNEEIFLVVSAFESVTNQLIKAIDELDEKDYSEEDINRAFETVKKTHETVIDKYFKEENREAAKSLYQREYQTLKQKLLTHKKITNILVPRDELPERKREIYKINDQVIGFGENVAKKILNLYLQQEGNESRVIDNVECSGYEANGTVSNPRLHEAIQRGIREAVEEDLANETRTDVIRILGGHVGSTPHGIKEDIGRSYSDTTAVDTSIALRRMRKNVTATTFWKKEVGVLTGNPKLLDPDKNHPVKHRHISLKEGLEIASAEGGSGLMQVSALALAKREKIPLEFKDIRTPHLSENGTKYTTGTIETGHVFKTIVANENIDVLSITLEEMADERGFIEAITAKLTKAGISVDGVFCEGTSLSFSLPLPKDRADKEKDRSKIEKVMGELDEGIVVDGEKYYPSDLSWDKGSMASIAIIGHELVKQEALSPLPGALEAHGIKPEGGMSVGKAQIRFSCLIRKKDCKKAVQLLHGIFVDKDHELVQSFKERYGRILDRMTGTYQNAT